MVLIIMQVKTGTLAQTPVNIYKSSGVEFSIPNGWIARELQGYIIAGSYDEKGVIIITQHQENDINAIITEAKSGIQDGISTSLQLISEIDHFNATTVGGTFAGQLDGYPSKAYIVSMISPYGGGITIMSATNTQSFSNRYKEITTSISQSVRFSRPDHSKAIEEWKALISGCKLSYYNSYNSGGGSGYTTVIKMSLCNQGYFVYNLDDQTVLNGQGNLTGAYSFQKNKGNGSWEVIGRGTEVLLQLNFHDGRVKAFSLSKNEKGHTLLNGERYLRTCNPNDSYAEARPDCR